MLRCMILLFSFLLITLSAAHLGRDEQLTRVLGLPSAPTRQVAEKAESVPIQPSSSLSEKSAPPYRSSSSQSPSGESSASSAVLSEESQPPRFIPDQPLPSSSHSTQPEPSAPEPLDPSAQALVSPAESQASYAPPILTEEQKLLVAEPYVKELFAIKENLVRQLQELGDEAIGEFLALDPDLRQEALSRLAAQYLPQAQSAADQADRQAQDILMRLTGALAAIGADDAIAQDARAAYEQSKQEEIEHYTQIFADLAG